MRAILDRVEQLELDARRERGDFRPPESLPRAPGSDLDDVECLVSLSRPSDHATTQPTGPTGPNEFFGSSSPTATLLDHARPHKSGDARARELYAVRADVLEIMAEEIASHPVNALTSFRKWEGGHSALDGMAKGTRWVIDREQLEWEKANEAELAALEARLRRTRPRRRPYRVWTAEEDRAVRARYVSDGAAAIAKALGRSAASVSVRANKLDVRRRASSPRWSERDDDMLRRNWGRMALPRIATRLKRKESAVYWRAHELGLSRGCPQGFVYLSNAGKAAGYDPNGMRTILAWANVPIYKSKSRKNPRASVLPGNHYVDPALAKKAVLAWLGSEWVTDAASARGLDRNTLRRWLLQAQASGVAMPSKPPRHKRWRVPTKVIDLVVSGRQRWQRWQPPRAFESTAAAARRVGIEKQVLAKCLRAAGVPFTQAREHDQRKNWWTRLVENSDVDRVVADINQHGRRVWKVWANQRQGRTMLRSGEHTKK